MLTLIRGVCEKDVLVVAQNNGAREATYRKLYASSGRPGCRKRAQCAPQSPSSGTGPPRPARTRLGLEPTWRVAPFLTSSPPKPHHCNTSDRLCRVQPLPSLPLPNPFTITPTPSNIMPRSTPMVLVSSWSHGPSMSMLLFI